MNETPGTILNGSNGEGEKSTEEKGDLAERIKALENELKCLREKIGATTSALQPASAEEGNKKAFEIFKENEQKKIKSWRLTEGELAVAAARQENVEVLEWMECSPIQAGDGMGHSPATIAVAKGNISLLQLLRQKGVDMRKQVIDNSDGLYVDPVMRLAYTPESRAGRTIAFLHKECDCGEILCELQKLCIFAWHDCRVLLEYIHNNVEALDKLSTYVQRMLLIQALNAGIRPSYERPHNYDCRFTTYDYLESLGFDTKTPVPMEPAINEVRQIGLTPSIHAGLSGNRDALRHLSKKNVDLGETLQRRQDNPNIVDYTRADGTMDSFDFSRTRLRSLTPCNALEGTVFSLAAANDDRCGRYCEYAEPTLQAYNYLVHEKGLMPREHLSSLYIERLRQCSSNTRRGAENELTIQQVLRDIDNPKKK